MFEKEKIEMSEGEMGVGVGGQAIEFEMKTSETWDRKWW